MEKSNLALKNLLKKKGYKNYSKLSKNQLVNYNEFIDRKLTDIRTIAKNLKIKKYYKMNKKELINSIYKIDKKYITDRINKTKYIELIEQIPTLQILEEIIEEMGNIDLVEEDDYKIEEEDLLLIQFINNFNEYIRSGNRNFNFGEDFSMMDSEIRKLALRHIAKTLNDLDSEDKFIFEVNGKYMTLNENGINSINNFMDENVVETELVGVNSHSDKQVEIAIDEEAPECNLIRLKPKKKGRAKGGFFDMYNKTDIDLSNYGVFKRNDMNADYDDNCFVQSLRYLNCDDKIIRDIKTMIKNNILPKKDIKIIAEKYDIRINVKTPGYVNEIKYGNVGEVYHLGLINNHYFAIDQINLTSYALKNYFELMEKFGEISQINNICKIVTKNGKKYFHREDIFISSYYAINYIFQNKDKYLEKMENSLEILSQFQKSQIDNYIKDLTYYEHNVRKVRNMFEVNESGLSKYDMKLEQLKNYNIVHADFETLRDYNSLCEIQIPDMIMKDETDFYGDIIEKRLFIGRDCAKKFLNSLKGNSILIFHNSSYDATFLQKFLFGDSIILKGKQLIQGNYLFKQLEKRGNTIKIIIKDSYAMIPTALDNFGKMFNLPINKAAISHEYYDYLNKEGLLKIFRNHDEYDYLTYKEPLETKYQSISTASKYIKDEDSKIEFIDNLIKWNLINPNNPDEFAVYKYRIEYCKLDVEVQKQGYNKFRQYIKEICGFDPIVFPTLASLGDAYLIKMNCYDDVNELSGIPREFIQKCAVGGRTMSNNNEKQKELNGKYINDFDAVSLYPSGMNRMKGFLKGRPQVINNLDYNVIKNYSGYFVEIKVTEVNKKLDFPIMSYRNDDGVRVWSNDMVGKTLYVDKVTLEDLIEFHKIKFELLKGYCFNDGHNNNINYVIRYLFDERSKAKKVKNPVQEIYKLLTNSCYGRSLLKPIDIESKVIKEDILEDYVCYNFSSIKSYIKLNDCNKYIVKQNKNIVDHFNRVQVGTEILSMSKRIMNEVMCTAENAGIKLFYQDTDSMHLFNEDIDTLRNIFNKKYNRELIGDDMGQFHSDFKIDGKSENVMSKKLIVLGKKSYIDELINIKTGKTDYHIRMKGIPNNSILYYCEKNDITPIKLYKKLYDGEQVTFDLTCGKTKSLLRYNNNMTYETLDIFSRRVQFN